MSELIRQETTLGGERWDTIALKCYGDATMVGRLIKANPEVPIYDVFPGGVVLNIPIIPKAEVKTDLEKLPPWKQ